MIGDRLYTLSERDVQARWLDPLFVNIRSGGILAAAIDVDFVIPVDRALILAAAVVDVFSGGAQTINRILIQTITDNGINIAFLWRSLNAGSSDLRYAGEGAASWSGRIIIPGGMTVRGSASFSAGAIANSVNLSLSGLLIPIGNVERV